MYFGVVQHVNMSQRGRGLLLPIRAPSVAAAPNCIGVWCGVIEVLLWSSEIAEVLKWLNCIILMFPAVRLTGLEDPCLNMHGALCWPNIHHSLLP